MLIVSSHSLLVLVSPGSSKRATRSISLSLALAVSRVVFLPQRGDFLQGIIIACQCQLLRTSAAPLSENVHRVALECRSVISTYKKKGSYSHSCSNGQHQATSGASSQSMHHWNGFALEMNRSNLKSCQKTWRWSLWLNQKARHQ